MSEQMPDSGAPRSESVAQQVGEMLRSAREARGESLTEAAMSLKLTQRQVEAMETGRFDLLPGMAFARGFLRNYARHLGLDPAAVMVAVEQPSVASGPAVELAPVSNAEGVMPAGGEGGRRTVMPVAVLVVGLVLVMLAGWYFDWFEPASAPTPTVEVVPPAPQPHDETPAGGETPPLVPPLAEPGAEAPQSAAPEPAAPEVAPAPPVLPQTTAPSAAAPEGVTPSAAGPAGAPSATTPAGEGGPQASGAGEPAGGAAEAGGRLQFRFNADSWVEVRDARGRILHSGLNAGGSTRTVQGEPPFALVVGNAAQVSLQRDGTPVDLAPHIRSNVARLSVK